MKYRHSGELITLEKSKYKHDEFGGDFVAPVHGTAWPCSGCEVIIDYNVGLGRLDEKNFQAVALLTAHFYKNREAVDSGNKQSSEVPMAAGWIIDSIMGE